jgi:hypothetical protein
MLAQQFSRRCANLFAHFAHTSINYRFAWIDSTLGHLPCVGAAVDAATPKNLLGVID